MDPNGTVYSLAPELPKRVPEKLEPSQHTGTGTAQRQCLELKAISKLRQLIRGNTRNSS